ncbi:MAG: tRNA pseudouridine(55) synthase TruB [Lachnospiraceae bacterium]|nr:tRNA pseudouridine(55) synthase TruB [Lachnospiraceae bacterium]
MKSGIINVYKEAGYTSFDVVAKLRGILGMKKIGHTGTLDPEATGVLPVCVGKATKVCDLLTDKDKTYRAVMRLGIVTDTQDMTGNVLQQQDVTVTEQEVRKTLQSFVGSSKQIPPMYSALKVNGQKLCDLARKGIQVERKPRDIFIHEIVVEDIALPLVTFTVTCSKGTYIRTLCQDVGEKLGCGACMDSLVRTRVSVFSIEDSLKLHEIEAMMKRGELEEHLVYVDEMFSRYPAVYALEEATAKLKNGNALTWEEVIPTDIQLQEKDLVRMYMADHRFVGIFIWKDHLFKPEKMFLE